MNTNQEPIHPAYEALGTAEGMIASINDLLRDLDGEVSSDAYHGVKAAIVAPLKELAYRVEQREAEIDAHEAAGRGDEPSRQQHEAVAAAWEALAKAYHCPSQEGVNEEVSAARAWLRRLGVDPKPPTGGMVLAL